MARVSMRSIRASTRRNANRIFGSNSVKKSKQSTSKYRAFYQTQAWRDLSRAQRQAEPFCVWCGEPAEIADHIIEIVDDPSRKLDHTNLQSMCKRCHNQKTAAEAAKRRERGKPEQDDEEREYFIC